MIFAPSYSVAYRHLAILADVLYGNHGLTLQKQKTKIMKAASYEALLSTPELKESQSLFQRFEGLLNELGLSNPYEPIQLDELTDEQKEKIASLNLSQLMEDELQSQEPEMRIVRFVIRRFAQLNDDSALDTILSSVEKLYPVFPDIIRYLLSLRGLSRKERHDIGQKVIELLSSSVLSELPWHRLWAFELFAHSNSWGQEDRFVSLLANSKDSFARRKLILALGRAGQKHWFNSHWRTLFDEPPWPRRALIAAASCMPTDARNHWYRSIEDRLDPVESAVARWARANPFAV